MITTRLLAPAVGAASILAGVLAALTASVAAADPAPPIPSSRRCPRRCRLFRAATPTATTTSRRWRQPRWTRAGSRSPPTPIRRPPLQGFQAASSAMPRIRRTSKPPPAPDMESPGACGRPRRRAPPVCSSRQAMKTPRWKIPTGAPHRASPVPRPSHPLSCPAHRRHPSWKTRTGSPLPPPRLPSGPDASRSDHIPGRGI